jgi:hypothetical protein
LRQRPSARWWSSSTIISRTGSEVRPVDSMVLVRL